MPTCHAISSGNLIFYWQSNCYCLSLFVFQVNICQKEFLLKNGDQEWLKGIDYAPKKLQNLMELNKILAHKPWLITVDHLKVCVL